MAKDKMVKASVKYIGDPLEDFSGPSVIKHSGLQFPKGQAVSVSMPESKLKKLQYHSHFEVNGQPALKAADVVAQDAPQIVDDEAETEADESRKYTADELAKVLEDNGVTVPKKFEGDAKGLMDLIVQKDLVGKLPE